MNIVDVRRQLARHNLKTYNSRSLEAIKYIAIHHSATTGGDAYSFARYHVNTRDWPGIAYHYVILKDGTIQWCQDLTTVSYHVGNYNTSAIGICLVGDFTREELKSPQKEALIQLCRKLLEDFRLTTADIEGHQFFTGNTSCPALDMVSLRSDIQSNEIKIYLEGQLLNMDSMIIEGVTYVPLRRLAEAFGLKVRWEEQSRSIFLEK